MGQFFNEALAISNGNALITPMRPIGSPESSFVRGYKLFPPDLIAASPELWNIRSGRESQYGQWMHEIRTSSTFSVLPQIEGRIDPRYNEITSRETFESLQRESDFLKALWAISVGDPETVEDRMAMEQLVKFMKYYTASTHFMPVHNISQFPYEKDFAVYPGYDLACQYRYTGRRTNSFNPTDVIIAQRAFLNMEDREHPKALTTPTINGNAIVLFPSILFKLTWAMAELNGMHSGAQNQISRRGTIRVPVISDPFIPRPFPRSQQIEMTSMGTKVVIVDERPGLPYLALITKDGRMLRPYGLCAVNHLRTGAF